MAIKHIKKLAMFFRGTTHQCIFRAVILYICSVADPINLFSDPDPTKYLDMFLMFSRINICYGIFLPNLNIP